MLPSPDILNNYPYGKFVLSNLAAKRAKQLREGAPPLVRVESSHPLTIALAEIAAGKIKPIMPAIGDPIDVIESVSVVIGENTPAELGMLLPALDETEAALVSSAAVLGDDHDDDLMHLDSDEPITLSDLVEDDDEPVVTDTGDNDTLSLTDIADQENIEEDEAEEA
jgi:DNA-directed RNA polymerase subunit omega